VATTVRFPEPLLDEIREIAAEEERALNTQILRLIRAGLEQYRAEHDGDRGSSVRPEQTRGD